MNKTFYPVPSVVVANYFIKKSVEEAFYMTQQKLLKLVYISHGWHLAMRDKSLISDTVEAWKYGPIIPELLKYTKRESGPRFEEEIRSIKIVWDFPIDLDFLSHIWDIYKKYSGPELGALTCGWKNHGMPWREIYSEVGGEERSGSIIPNDVIVKYFKKMLYKKHDE